MTLLSEILARKKREIATLSFPVHPRAARTCSFVSAIKSRRPSLIAEIKPISPIGGRLLSDMDIPSTVETYVRHAQAISVLCDHASFGGGFDVLAAVRAQTDLPLLAKDFVLDEIQIILAAHHGADAILLIASLLSDGELLSFAKRALGLGLDVLLELHAPADVDCALKLLQSLNAHERTRILLGINNRDLKTQKIDLQTTPRIVKLLQKHPELHLPCVSESGIATKADVKALTTFVQGFLIGSSILQSENPDEFLSSMFSCQKPALKFCGMTQAEDIRESERLGVEYLGFIFVAASPRSIELKKAVELRKTVQRAKVVGVFAEQSAKEIEQISQALNLDFIQLHGIPDLAKARALRRPVIQAFRGVPQASLLEKFLTICPYVLIDKADGETEADFAAIAALPSEIRHRLFLAGGLTPKNARSLSEQIQPYALDCARGIESAPGIKDHNLMLAFSHTLS